MLDTVASVLSLVSTGTLGEKITRNSWFYMFMAKFIDLGSKWRPGDPNCEGSGENSGDPSGNKTSPGVPNRFSLDPGCGEFIFGALFSVFCFCSVCFGAFCKV